MSDTTKFTKGEWKQHPTAKHLVSISRDGDDLVIVDCYKETVASPDEAEANAKLIAAAPEMLNKLQVIHDYFKTSSGDNLLTGGKVLIASIEMLIKKATS